MIVRETMQKTTRLIEFSDRDRRILDTLTARVRLLSLSQIARVFWSGVRDPRVAARKRLAVLERTGFLERLNVLARPELPLPAPVAKWAPGEAPPNFGAVAYQVQARWEQAPTPTTVVVATARAGHWCGGQGGRRPRTSEITHDLHLAAVYLRLLAEWPIGRT